MWTVVKVILIVLVILAVCYLYMILPRFSKRKELAKYAHTMFAHRGYHNQEQYIPENSMMAFQAAVDKGYGIELDVHLTKDGKLAVFHDDTLERMCGISGNVEDYTMEELGRIHLSGTMERIPELGKVLKLVKGRVPLLIEIKIPEQDLGVCQAVYEALADYEGDYMIQSFNTLGLRWFKKQAPEVLRGQLASNLMKSDPDKPFVYRFMVRYLLSNVFGRPDFISYKMKDLPNVSVAICQKWLKTSIAVWTLRSNWQIRLAEKRYDMYIFEKRGEDY